jgi:hypothetical protein
MENTEGGKKISYMRILQIHNKYLEKGGEDTVTSNVARKWTRSPAL